MSLSIYPSRAALAAGTILPFSGINGTAPFTYQVISGDGTIDASGVYTAPDTVPGPQDDADIVQVTDSLGAIAEAEIFVTTPLGLVGDIIQTYMGLDPGRVYLWDQKINEPTDEGLFIAIGIINVKPIGNNRRADSAGSGMESVQTALFLANVSIDIISRGPDARDRKEEVLMALQSQYAEKQMNLNGFMVATQSTSFVNLSEVDGAAIPYRFNISVNMQYTVEKRENVDFYDAFADPSIYTDP